MDQDLTNWTWDDAPITGEVTNESYLEQGYNVAVNTVNDFLDLRAKWFGATDSAQKRAIETVEYSSNPQANQPTQSTIAGINSKYILGGLVLLGLALYARS